MDPERERGIETQKEGDRGPERENRDTEKWGQGSREKGHRNPERGQQIQRKGDRETWGGGTESCRKVDRMEEQRPKVRG